MVGIPNAINIGVKMIEDELHDCDTVLSRPHGCAMQQMPVLGCRAVFEQHLDDGEWCALNTH
jgi:hypothetical protein